MTFDYYDSLPDEQLKDIARENGIPTQGGRIKIIERLINLNEDIFRQQIQTPLSQVVDIQQLQQSILPPIKPQCQYGNTCYRTSPAHFEEYNHPAQLLLQRQMQAQVQITQHQDPPQFFTQLDGHQQILLQQMQQAHIQVQAPDHPIVKTQCPYGNSCYRKNPVHFSQYDHPQELLDKIKLEAQQLQEEEPINNGESKLSSAFDYLAQIKAELPNLAYNEFLTIMKEFKNQAIDIPTTIDKVVKLFNGNNKLILGFNTFLPEHHKITEQSILLNGDFDKDKSTDGVDLISEKLNSTTINDKQHQNVYITPPQIQQPQTSPQKQDPLNEARDYVNTVKSRFSNQPAIYRDFLGTLHAYHKENLTIKQIYDKVETLFKGHDDLILGFTTFLPDTQSTQQQ